MFDETHMVTLFEHCINMLKHHMGTHKYVLFMYQLKTGTSPSGFACIELALTESRRRWYFVGMSLETSNLAVNRREGA